MHFTSRAKILYIFIILELPTDALLELESKGKHIIDEAQVVLGQPDCLGHGVQVAVDVRREDGGEVGDEGVLERVALFLQENYHVVKSQPQVRVIHVHCTIALLAHLLFAQT